MNNLRHKVLTWVVAKVYVLLMWTIIKFDLEADIVTLDDYCETLVPHARAHGHRRMSLVFQGREEEQA